jgi:hypothetical protein
MPPPSSRWRKTTQRRVAPRVRGRGRVKSSGCRMATMAQ